MKGARCNIQNDLGKSAFTYACENKNKTFIQPILTFEEVSFSIDKLFTSYPLHNGCQNGDFPVIQYLIEKGANIESKNKDEVTPLYFASFYGKTDVVKYLVSKEANKNANNMAKHHMMLLVMRKSKNSSNEGNHSTQKN